MKNITSIGGNSHETNARFGFGGGADATYAGHVFAVDSQTQTQITLTATAYYTADVYTGQPFYTAPADGSGYTARTYRFVLTDEGRGFRFSEFAFMQ